MDKKGQTFVLDDESLTISVVEGSNRGRGRFRGRGRGKGRQRRNGDACHVCGRTGHWARDYRERINKIYHDEEETV